MNKTNDPETSTEYTPVKKPRTILIIAITLIVVAIVTGCVYAGVKFYEQSKADDATLSQHQTLENDGNKVVTKEEGDIAGVVERVSPSVVSIVTKAQADSPYGLMEQEGAGTGIIVGKDGYILTNKHVVSGASTVGVVLADGTTYDNVKVLGSDPLNDVAFLKVDGVDNLPAAEMGDSSSIRVGQRVVAIGNSLGQYQNTVTSGIISGIGRPITAQAGESVESLSDLLQTDAAINPGNSGGPLLNINGQVIGINTAIIEDAQGIGFSIPINATKGILKGVLAGKGVQRAYIGVSFVSITPDAAKHYNISAKKGAYIIGTNNQSAIIPGSPAEKAGIKEKDIITKVGGVNVGDGGGMSSLIAEYAPGDTIELTVLRGSETLTIRITLDAYKSNASGAQ